MIENSALQGAYFTEQLRSIRCDAIKEVRGRGLMMAVEAMKKAGTVTDAKAIRDALASMEYSGVIGTVKFDRTGQASPPVFVTQWCSDGRRRIIYPESFKADCGAG